MDQQRREGEIRRRLRKYEAKERAEREEMKEAIRAVEDAERVLREEREVEERRVEEEVREVQKREQERLRRVEGYFGYLRGVLDRLCEEQVVAMGRRHERELEGVRGMRDAQNLASKIHQQKITNIDYQESELGNRIIAERKWAEVLREARLAMLAEDEGRVRGNGGDVPDVPELSATDPSVADAWAQWTPVLSNLNRVG